MPSNYEISRQYILKAYPTVPRDIRRGMPVRSTYYKHRGLITSFDGGHVIVKLEGETFTRRFHPQELEYFPLQKISLTGGQLATLQALDRCPVYSFEVTTRRDINIYSKLDALGVIRTVLDDQLGHYFTVSEEGKRYLQIIAGQRLAGSAK